MFLNSTSSTETNSDEDKYRGRSMVDWIFHEDKHIRQDLTRRKSFDESSRVHHGFDYHRSTEDLRLEKTGWLNVKHWLTISIDEKVEMVSKNSWKRFWIWLKDSNLHLFDEYLGTNPTISINTINCLCYPFPEHRQYVFSLTTHTGDTYCLQALNQSDMDHWIRCIHSNSLEKIHLRSLESILKQSENDILYENKILKLAELQLKLTTNENTRSIISKQIQLLETNLENLHCELFRQKCYLTAFDEHSRLPNAKDLLAQISSTTKIILYNLHAFTPAAVYAYVICRERLNCHQSQMSISSELMEMNQTVLFDSNPQQKIVVSINPNSTVGELLKRVSEKFDVEQNDYFLYFNSTTLNGFIPNSNAKLNSLTYSTIELCRKLVYEIILYNQLSLSGIEIHRQSSSSTSNVFVSYVNKGSEGERLGVMKGDEITLINHFLIKDLDSTKLNRYLNQMPILLTLRSSRLNQGINNTAVKINQDATRSSLINEQHLSSKSLSHAQQREKLIFELIQTERSYIQDIQCLLKQYIEPLRQKSTVLPSDAIESLANSIKAIHRVQNVFFENLQSSFHVENNLHSIAEIFIQFSKDFKIYSSYCAIHSRIHRLLTQHQNNDYLKEFLRICNPYQQHSSSFESFLIKPVQRILKYPLFLQQMFLVRNLDDEKEIHLLKKSMKMMNRLSKYINSMQELYEEFGQSFEQFLRSSKEQFNQIIELNLMDLCAYGELEWMNVYRFLSRKNTQLLKTFCFVFHHGCLLLVREESNKKIQDSKNFSDCLIRFLPMGEIQVESLCDNHQDHRYTWQIIQTNPKNQLKTYFRFANTDGHMFVKAIRNCLSESSSNQDILTTMRLSREFETDDDYLSKRRVARVSSSNHRRSPSPIWKRRTISMRKRPMSMPNNKNAK